jgi:hypothetical protein
VAVTVTGVEVASQPVALVTVTEYVPDCFTVMLDVEAPVDQRIVPPAPTLSTTESPWQKLSGPLALTVATGNVPTVSVVVAELAGQLPLLATALVTV